MSDNLREAAPYRPPASAKSAAAPTQRPKLLSAVCVISVVLGVSGLLSALSSLAALVFQDQMQSFFAALNPPGTSSEMADLQNQMQSDMKAVTDQFRPVNYVLVPLHFIITSALLYGGLRALQLHPSSRQVLVAACGAAFAFDVIRGILGVVVQLKTTRIVSEYMDRMAGESDRFMTTIMTVSVGIGIVLGLIVILAKLLFYGLSVVYLRKPHVRELFQASNPEPTI